MRAGRVVVLVALVVGLMAAPAHAAPHFVVGQGQNPGVAIDAAGTAYIGWQVNTHADAGDSVQLCVLPAGARACVSLATIAFPGSGFDNGRVSVLLPAPGVVQVAVGRNVQNVYGYYLGTSGDGGATFNAPIRIGGDFAKRAELLPGGLIAAQGNDVRSLTGAVLRPDGSDAQAEPADLGERAQFSDVTVQGSDVYVAGSLAGPTSVAHLPAGAASSDPNAWQRLPDIDEGDVPRLAPGPAGPLVLMQSNVPGSAALFVRHWNGTAWTPHLTIGPDNVSQPYAIAGAGPRVVAAWARNLPSSGYLVQFASSVDGGALWSTAATLAVLGDQPQALESATLPTGVGVVVDGGSFEDKPIDVYRVDPHRAKVARARFGSTTVQLRADDGDCIPDTQLSLRVQAARGGVLVSPGSVLRAARISVSRSSVERRGRWTLLVDLRRSRAKRTATVRLVPRHGRSRTLRLPVRGCGRVA
jgi:hypothetical protein